MIMSLPSAKNLSKELKKIHLLSYLSDNARDSFANKCRRVDFKPNHSVVERGMTDTSVYFIITGAVHVLNYSETGRAITYATLTEGDMFGELAAIDGLPRSAWVCTITPCQMATASSSEFLKLLSDSSEISLALLRRMSSYIRLLDERLTDLTLLGAEQRSCTELLRMAKPDLQEPGGYVVSPMPTHANFGNLVGVSRETVSRIFRKLREDSLIVHNKRGLCIPNRKELERRAFL
jgi:CRP/FNR family transcriptional regulator, cyclic AMP receptor protein